MRYHNECIDGTIQGWPCNAWIMRENGSTQVDLSVIAYTDNQDNPAPKPIKRICEDVSEHLFPSLDAARKALKATGFVGDKS
jgi:hypothetical protein